MKKRRLLALLLALAMIAAACGDDGGTDTTAAPSDDGATATTAAPADDGEMEDDGEMMEAVTIDYWLWDGNQQPFYEQCATDFEAANPDIDVVISQFGWGDYWDGLTTAFASNTAPDVFTDHLARYPELVASGVLVPLNDYAAADGVEDIYFPGLADLWKDPAGDQYGFPKDFDTVAIPVNAANLADAGLTVDDFANATWNPQDGGTFEQLIAKLSVDANGVRGDEAGFDAENVETYGFGLEGGFGAFGQTTFSAFAYSTGFEFLNQNPWGTQANYDDDRLADTIAWFRSGIEKGYIAPLEDTVSLGGFTMYENGLVSSMTNGSWMISSYSGLEGTDTVWAPLPQGPEGRKSMFNGLADSITTSAEHPDQAWKWVAYMASAACQEIVGSGAVVFPAIPSAAKIAQEAHATNGVDVSAFTTHVDNGTTFLFPITSAASEVEAAVGPVMEAILLGQVDDPYAALDAANEQVNAALGG
jgi:multiple sugar transport system substrate-binding protein